MTAGVREETTNLVKSFNELGIKPLLVAIKENNRLMFTFLSEVLKAPVNQMGIFLLACRWPSFASRHFMKQDRKNLTHTSSISWLHASNTGERPINICHVCFYFILASPVSNRTQKIDIFELLGAAFIHAEMTSIATSIVVISREMLDESAYSPSGDTGGWTSNSQNIWLNTHFKHVSLSLRIIQNSRGKCTNVLTAFEYVIFFSLFFKTD